MALGGAPIGERLPATRCTVSPADPPLPLIGDLW